MMLSQSIKSKFLQASEKLVEVYKFAVFIHCFGLFEI